MYYFALRLCSVSFSPLFGFIQIAYPDCVGGCFASLDGGSGYHSLYLGLIPSVQLANDWVESWVYPIGLRLWASHAYAKHLPLFHKCVGVCMGVSFTPLDHGLNGKLS